MASFVVQELGLALAPKTCPHRPQAFKKLKIGGAFPQENIIFTRFFSERPLQVL